MHRRSPLESHPDGSIRVNLRWAVSMTVQAGVERQVLMIR